MLNVFCEKKSQKMLVYTIKKAFFESRYSVLILDMCEDMRRNKQNEVHVEYIVEFLLILSGLES